MISATVWTALAAIATALGFGVALLVHIVKYAYKQGQTDQRLSTVEAAQGSSGALNALVAALTATVNALEQSVMRLDRAVESLRGRESRPIA